jgi:branched-chain amino acid transport system ATP-binding protein
LSEDTSKVVGQGLQIKSLAVHYGRVQALREVSIGVGEGEIVTIVGANGAGKSTLLNAIAGVVTTSGGEIRWNGRTITGLSAHRVVRAGVGYVPEGREIFSSLSVEDNLLLGAYVFSDRHGARGLRGLWTLLGPASSFARKPAVAANFDRVYALFPRLAERRIQQAGSLSGGEQQMLAIGRALMSSPRILLLDEPSIGLAPVLVREVLRLLPRLRDEGLTVLLVEQDAVAALRVADRGYVLERGSVVVEGPAAELLATDRVQRAYLGRAAERSWRERPRWSES